MWLSGHNCTILSNNGGLAAMVSECAEIEAVLDSEAGQRPLSVRLTLLQQFSHPRQHLGHDLLPVAPVAPVAPAAAEAVRTRANG